MAKRAAARVTESCSSSRPAASTARCPKILGEDEALPTAGCRRRGSAAVLGVARVEFLGYDDSGMMGETRTTSPASLLAGRRRRGRRAARRDPARGVAPTCSPSTTTTAATAIPTTSRCTASACGRPSSPARPRVFEATMNRDHILREHRRAPRSSLGDVDFDRRPDDRRRQPTSACPRRSSPAPSTSRAYVDRKRESMRAHASQIADIDVLPPDARRGVRRARSAPSGSSARATPTRHPRDTSSPASTDAAPRTWSATARPPPVGTTTPIPASTTSAAPRPRRWRPRWRRSARCPSSSARCGASGRRPRRSTTRGRPPRSSSRGRRDPLARPACRWSERAAWLRSAMAGTWADLGRRLLRLARRRWWRACGAIDSDTVVVTHFVAINAAIGAALGDDQVVIAPPRQLLGRR